MKAVYAIIICVFLAAAATQAGAQEFNSEESFIKRVREGTGSPLTDKDLAYIYKLGDATGFLCDTTQMSLAARNKLHALINDSRLTAGERAAKVHERIGADITDEDRAYLKSIGYDHDPPESGDAVIARAHVHYFIHDPDLTPAQREANVHDAYHENQAFIDQQAQADEADAAAEAAARERPAPTATDFWLEALDRDPAAVAPFLLLFAALCLLPAWPLAIVIRGMRSRTLTHAARKTGGVVLLIAGVASAMQFFSLSHKSDYILILPAPILIAVAAALWLERFEKRHVLAFSCLAVACLSTAVNGVTGGAGPLAAVSGLGMLGSIVGASAAAVTPPYLAQGRADILSRIAALVACLSCLGFGILMGLLAMVARVTM